MKSKILVILCGMAVLVSIACVVIAFRGEAPQFDPDNLPAGKVGAPYETEIHISENDTPVYLFEVSKGALPAGLELLWKENADTAKISGIPEEAGTFTFTLSIQCLGTNVSGETSEQEYSIVVEE